MELVKDAALRFVMIHDGTPGRHCVSESVRGGRACDTCPWGEMREATLIVNGFPHRRILAFSPDRLRRDVMEWMEGLAI
jgi:hypothetical protein